MKKIFSLLLVLALFPVRVNAAEVRIDWRDDLPLYIGNRVEVWIEGDKTLKTKEFFVMRDTAPEEKYVWLIYNGNVEDPITNASITVYDQATTGGDEEDPHEATAVLENAKIYSVLLNGTSSWDIKETPRLLNAADLAAIGVKKNTSGKYEITPAIKWLAPVVDVGEDDPSGYNYWTQIEDESAENTSVFAVTYNESYNGDTLMPVATLESYDITPITEGPEFLVRPVVLVDKSLIDCVFGQPETTTIKNVQTSEVTMPLQIVSVLAVAGVAYVLIRKKDLFNKI